MMNGTMVGRTGGVTLCLAICFTVAACGGQTNRETSAVANETENAAVAENVAQEPLNRAGPAEAEKTEEQGRSIIRPDIASAPPPAPEPPEPEPVHAIVPFGASGLKLDDKGREAIDAILARPVVRLGGPIVLRGHTDSRGADGDNLVASRIRAESVRDYLLSKGIAGDRIEVIALGETRPIAPNAHADGSDDPESRARNRRVEIDVELPAKETEKPPAVD